jgi:hypothetical protein
MRHARLPVSPSLTIVKAKSIPKFNYKASWQWLSQFKAHCELQKMLLHEEGTKVNNNNLELLVASEEHYEIIA